MTFGLRPIEMQAHARPMPHFATPLLSHSSSSMVTTSSREMAHNTARAVSRDIAFPITSTISSCTLVSMFGMQSKIACGVLLASSQSASSARCAVLYLVHRLRQLAGLHRMR